MISTSDGCEQRHRDVRKLAISNKCQGAQAGCSATNSSQVGCSNACQVVPVESEGAIDNCQRRNIYGRNVSQSHVSSPDQVWERDNETLAIGVDVDAGGDIGNLGAEGLQTVVVIDLKDFNSVQVNTVKGA